jgi:hypothetical protein
MKRITLLLIVMVFSFIGCSENEDDKIQQKVSAEFVIDDVKYNFESILDMNSGGVSRSFSSVTGNSDNGLFLGTHFYYCDSICKIIEVKPSAKEKAMASLNVTSNMSKTFPRTSNTIKESEIDCFTCYANFLGEGFSLTYMENISKSLEKKIWTTGYGEQNMPKLEITNLRIIETNYPDIPQIGHSLLGDLEFKCLLYDKDGMSKMLTGKATMSFYSFIDF